MNPPPESDHPELPFATGESAPTVPEAEPDHAASAGDGHYPPAELAYPVSAGGGYDPAAAGFEYSAQPEGELAAAPEYEYAAPYEGDLGAAAPPEYEYLATSEGELTPPTESEPPASVEQGHTRPPGPASPAPSAAEPFPVLEPETAPFPAAPDFTAHGAGIALVPGSTDEAAPPAYPPAEDESRYAPGAEAAPAPPPEPAYLPPGVPDEQVALLCEGLERFLGAAEARVHVLRGVSLRLEPGFVHAVVGPSGCGKSSLLYILGLLDRPDAGRLVISGRPVANLDDDDLSRQRSALLGFIFQFHFLLQDFTAQENIMIPMRQLGVLSEAQMRARASDLLDAVGLGDKGHRASRHLSGGEQQRVAIARALANDPQVILADEPTGNLDTANSTRVFSLLTDLVHRENKALLLVTHNPAIAEACDWVHTMRDGLIVEQQFVGARR